MINFLKKYKIFLLALAVIIVLILIIIKYSGILKRPFIEGIVLDIDYSEVDFKNPNLLVKTKDGPIFVDFQRKVDIQKQNIGLLDNVYITTSGEMMESFPPKVYGYNILLDKKAEKFFRDFDVYFISSNKKVEESKEEFDYRRFKTKVLSNKNEYLDFAKENNITTHIEEKLNLDKLFQKNVFVVSYAYISERPTLQYFGTYRIENNIYIQLDLKSPQNYEDNLILRGSIVVIDKDFIKDAEIEAVCQNIKTN